MKCECCKEEMEFCFHVEDDMQLRDCYICNNDVCKNYDVSIYADTSSLLHFV